jgi:hypothetical protein
MAKPGDPFETDPLDEKRSEQRRDLRCVADWIIVEVARQTPLSKTIQPQDAPLLEAELRALADRDRQRIGDEYFVRSAMGTVAPILSDLLLHVDNDSIGRTFTHGFSPAVTDLAEEYYRVQKSEAVAEDPGIVARYVMFLLWADRLAGDYTDPRVPDAARAAH